MIDNARSKIISDSPVVMKLASDCLSFAQPGAHFARIPGWDGRIRMMKKDGTYPTGLTYKLIKMLRGESIEFKAKDLRTRPTPTIDFQLDLGDKTPRYYQNDADLVSEEKPRGVYLMGTGAGKTLTSALIVKRKRVPTLFVTPDTGLKEQAYADFSNWFGIKNVGTSVEEDAPLIVTNIQSISAALKRDEKIFEKFGMLMVDEFHHSAADSYLDLNLACVNAYYRYGFTGTFVRPDGSDMHMHGVLANVIFKKTTSELIEEGFLVRPFITMYEMHLPKLKLSYKEAYDWLTEYQPFHNHVAGDANTKIEHKKQTLVLVRRKEHGRDLAKLIPKAVFVSGDDKKSERRSIKNAFIDKRIPCLIATNIFGEGQDIPTLDGLINARAEKTEIQTAQGIGRTLRKAPGKDKAEITDYYFVGQRHLTAHSGERLASYKRESAFQVQVKKVD